MRRLESRLLAAREQRWSGTISSPYGWGWSDPAAIPPPNMRNIQNAGVTVNLHTALQVDAVWVALRIISNNITKLGDLRAYREQLSKDNVPYHVWLATQPPVLDNTYSSGWQTAGMRQTVVSLALLGEVFWIVLDRDRLGYPTMVEVLHPGLMEVKPDDDGNPTYWYGVGTQRVQLATENVIHVPFMSLPHSSRGLNPIEYASIDLALHLASLEFGARFFSQGSSPGYALTTDANPNVDEVRRLAESFVVQHAGLTNAHLPLVLTNGLKAQQIQIAPDEAQFDQTLSSARNAIATWFGIPGHLMGSANDKGNSFAMGAAEELSKQFVQHTLSGYIAIIEELYSKLLPNGVRAAFNVNKLVFPDAQSQAAQITALRNTQSMAINDVRTRILGLPPLDDPLADDPLAPLASNTAPEQTDNESDQLSQESAGSGG